MGYEYKVRIGLCAYIDILGTSNLLRQISEQNEILQIVIERTEIVRKSSEEATTFLDLDDFETHIHFFSDSHFLAVTDILPPKAASGDPIFLYCSAARLLAIHQLQLIQKGIFVRGGLAMGAIAFDGSGLVGKPISDAVDLEKSANYPGIVVSEPIELDVSANFSNKIYNTDYFSYRATDNRLIINPFSVLSLFLNEKGGKDIILDCRNSLMKNMYEFHSDSKLQDKFGFLCNLWNYSICTFNLDESMEIALPKSHSDRFKFTQCSNS